MDEMKIKSSFMNNLLSKILQKVINSKFGIDITINTEDINIVTDDIGYVYYTLGVSGKIHTEDVRKLIGGNK